MGEAYQRILEDLYAGIEDNEAMSHAFDRICRQAGTLVASCEKLELATGSFSTLVQSGQDPSHTGFSLLEDRAREVNPYYEPDVFMRIIGEAQFANDVLPRSTVKRTAYYSDYLRPLGISDIAGYFFQPEPGIIHCISFPRDGRGSFGLRERELFQGLTPHMMRAFEIRHRLHTAAQTRSLLEQALNTMEHGLLLINSAGRVVWHNITATDIINRRDGLTLKMGQFSIQGNAENAQFQQLLLKQLAAAALDAQLQQVENFYLPSRSGLTPYVISLHCLSERLDWPGLDSAVVCALVADPLRSHSVTVQQLMTQYTLTPAEARVSVGVGFGWSLENIAERLGQKVSTTRNLLKRAMRKTDTHRQAELGARIWALSIPTTNAPPAIHRQTAAGPAPAESAAHRSRPGPRPPPR